MMIRAVGSLKEKKKKKKERKENQNEKNSFRGEENGNKPILSRRLVENLRRHLIRESEESKTFRASSIFGTSICDESKESIQLWKRKGKRKREEKK
jgi:hypothetical protein